jgi:uncharacterized membrane protein
MTPDWLEELAGSLRGPRRARLRLLAELEAHVEDAIADGFDEQDVLARLGSPSAVADRWNADASRRRWQVRAQILAAAFAVAAVAAPVGFAQRPSHHHRPAATKSSRPSPSASAWRHGSVGRGR